MSRLPNLVNQRFGHLIVIKLSDKKYINKGKGISLYTCKCDCGNVCDVRPAFLLSGHTKSCGHCNFYEDCVTHIKCTVKNGRYFIFDKEDDSNYVVHYCSDNTQKTLRFNINNCDKCYCKMYWYDGNIKDTTGNYGMACKKEENKAHCFTYYGYETWRNFQNNVDDFQNCIGLNF